MNTALTIYNAAIITSTLGQKTDEEIGYRLKNSTPQDIAIVRELYAIIEDFWITGDERIEKVEEIFRKHGVLIKDNWREEL